VKLVVDASVIVKWLFNDPEREEYTSLATDLMRAVIAEDAAAVQPFHWLLEVAAVIARETPERARADIGLLHALDLPVRSGTSIVDRACVLAIDLQHHLFDTLYHAVALEHDAMLVTADDRYYRKAAGLQGIMHLRDWRAPS
jgi:predicted nucleic acid-binding protein